MSSWESIRFRKRVHLTHHAMDRIARRGLEESLVKGLIENGTVKRKDEKHWWIYKAFADRNDNLVCAAVISGEALIVKTVMTHWEEGEV